jgi:hypothetical protein
MRKTGPVAVSQYQNKNLQKREITDRDIRGFVSSKTWEPEQFLCLKYLKALFVSRHCLGRIIQECESKVARRRRLRKLIQSKLYRDLKYLRK